MEKIEVNLMGGHPNGHTVTVLEGHALEQKEPVKITITGNIHAVAEFIGKRQFDIAELSGIPEPQRVDKGVSLVIVDRNAGTITLRTRPNDFYGTEVTAKLEISEEVAAFRINGKNTMIQKEVIDILRFNKIHFDDPDKHAMILKAYQAFSYTATATGKNESDSRGNKQANFAKTVETSLPSEFILHVPIFKGEASKKFRVEICLDVTDGGARFWFESVELHELIVIEKERIFERELKACEGLVVIHK